MAELRDLEDRLTEAAETEDRWVKAVNKQLTELEEEYSSRRQVKPGRRVVLVELN